MENLKGSGAVAPIITMGGRDTATSPFRNNNGKLDTYSLAEQLLEDYHVVRIKCDNQPREDMLYIFNNGIYEYNMTELECAIRRYGRGAKPSEIKTTLQDLLSMSPLVEETPYNYVAFNNCIVDINTLDTFDFDPNKFVITSKVSADYGIEPTSNTVELVDKFFTDISCGNTEIQNLLYEIIGYCMLRTAKYQRAFILTGNANNGKSDYLYIITKLLGKYCSNKNLFQLSNLNNLRSLYKCTANVTDDVEDISRVDFSKIRTLISGNAKIAIQCNKENEFAFEPYATLLLGTTHILDFIGCGDEIFRRFKVIPFNAKFYKSTVDRNMTENITSPASLGLIATRAIQAVSKLGREWEFPATIEHETDSYFFKGNPILAFGKTHPVKRIISVDNYYRDFAVWHSNTFFNETDIPKATFSKRLSYLLNMKSELHTLDGVKDNFFMSSDFNLELCKQQRDEYCKSTGTPMTILQYVDYIDKLDNEKSDE